MHRHLLGSAAFAALFLGAPSGVFYTGFVGAAHVAGLDVLALNGFPWFGSQRVRCAGAADRPQ